MLSSTQWRICIMGAQGFSARCIARFIKKYDGEEYSLSTIYKTLKQEGISIRDYRNGETVEAETTLNKIGASKPGIRKPRKGMKLKQAG